MGMDEVIGKRTFTLTCDWHETGPYYLHVADMKWRFVDEKGHVHFWVDLGNGQYALPSLVEVGEGGDEDDYEGGFSYYVCKECGHVVQPSYKLQYHESKTVRGLMHCLVDDVEVDLDEFLTMAMEDGMTKAEAHEIREAAKADGNGKEGDAK